MLGFLDEVVLPPALILADKKVTGEELVAQLMLGRELFKWVEYTFYLPKVALQKLRWTVPDPDQQLTKPKHALVHFHPLLKLHPSG